mmetsp:Transcript_40468/g.63170  ORF Transcript_40468/g.63170 Transcript_40468/m.63170 type:complete len:182 (+) Transcript_40468:23-568(+)
MQRAGRLALRARGCGYLRLSAREPLSSSALLHEQAPCISSPPAASPLPLGGTPLLRSPLSRWTPFRRFSSHLVMKGSKKLSDFVKLDLLEREDPVRILEIWMEYFSKKEGEVAGVLSDAEYDILSFRTNKSPLSILPVKAGEGYKVVAAQTSSLNLFPDYTATHPPFSLTRSRSVSFKQQC